MNKATLISDRGQPILCWSPLPNHYFAVSAYPTEESVIEHYRRTCSRDPESIAAKWLAEIEEKATATR